MKWWAFLLRLLTACTKREPPPIADAAPAPPPSPVVVDAEDVVKKSCLSCHTEQMLQQQRLTEAQWAKTVAKMTSWGANLEPSDTPALVAYLSAKYGLDAGAYVPTIAPVDELEATDDGVFANGNAENGHGLYQDKCAGCHGTDARGHIGVNLVDRPILYRASEFAGMVRRGRGKMPGQHVTDPQLADILSFLRQQR